MTRLRARASLASLGPGPRRGPMEISYSSLTLVSNQSKASAGPVDVKSSPCTVHEIFFALCQKTFGLAIPCTKPIRTRAVLYSSCQPSAAGRVPYMWRSSSPHILPLSGSSGGSSTKQGAASLSTFALKYARFTSMKLNCCRCGENGSHNGRWSPQHVIAMLSTVRNASNGGAGAK